MELDWASERVSMHVLYLLVKCFFLCFVIVFLPHDYEYWSVSWCWSSRCCRGDARPAIKTLVLWAQQVCVWCHVNSRAIGSQWSCTMVCRDSQGRNWWCNLDKLSNNFKCLDESSKFSGFTQFAQFQSVLVDPSSMHALICVAFCHLFCSWLIVHNPFEWFGCVFSLFAVSEIKEMASGQAADSRACGLDLRDTFRLNILKRCPYTIVLLWPV